MTDGRLCGAVFGVTGGWERGLWYARDDSERDLPYSVGDQPWYPIVEREAAQMQDGAVLLDLSPFGKFDITGSGAVSFLNDIACAQVDVDIGRAVYTPILNARGADRGGCDDHTAGCGAVPTDLRGGDPLAGPGVAAPGLGWPRPDGDGHDRA